MQTVTCFVVMGYEKKKIHGSNKILDLDKVYYKFIKPVIQKNKLVSIYNDINYRADEISTTEAINKIFLKALYWADIVIADISTLNQNAIYELGLRHAMKPKSTIILCDTETFKRFKFFDISMQPQLQYNYDNMLENKHTLNNTQKKLSNLIQTCIISKDDYIDSPVFDLGLYKIQPHSLTSLPKDTDKKSLREYLNEGNNFLENNNFEDAENAFRQALSISFDINIFCKYILSRYKKDIRKKNLLSTLHNITEIIDLSSSTNEELLGITAAINKHLFILTNQDKYYYAALDYYRRGSNYESDTLYCRRNYCAMLLKIYLVDPSPERLIEYFYTAKYNANVFIHQASITTKEKINFNDCWYNANIDDLMYIYSGKEASIHNFNSTTKRQYDTIKNGREELKADYCNMLKQINVL